MAHQNKGESESRSVMSDSLRPHGLYVHGILQARILEWVAFPFSRDLPNPEIKPRSLVWQVDSLPVEPQGKPFAFLGTENTCFSVDILYIFLRFFLMWTVF